MRAATEHAWLLGGEHEDDDEQLEGLARWTVLLGALVAIDGIWRTTSTLVPLRPSEADALVEPAEELDIRREDDGLTWWGRELDGLEREMTLAEARAWPRERGEDPGRRSWSTAAPGVAHTAQTTAGGGAAHAAARPPASSSPPPDSRSTCS